MYNKLNVSRQFQTQTELRPAVLSCKTLHETNNNFETFFVTHRFKRFNLRARHNSNLHQMMRCHSATLNNLYTLVTLYWNLCPGSAHPAIYNINQQVFIILFHLFSSTGSHWLAVWKKKNLLSFWPHEIIVTYSSSHHYKGVPAHNGTKENWKFFCHSMNYNYTYYKRLCYNWQLQIAPKAIKTRFQMMNAHLHLHTFCC